MMSTTMTTMPQPPQQMDSPLPPPTHSSTNPSKLPIELAEIPLQTMPYMDNPNHFYPLKPMLKMLQTTTQPPADDHLDPPPVPLATSAPLTVLLSRTERFLNNTHMKNSSLWTLAAIYQCHTPNPPNGPCMFPVHHLAHKPSTFPITATLQYYNNNPLKAGTYNYTPAFDIHLTLSDYRQQCYQCSTR